MHDTIIILNHLNNKKEFWIDFPMHPDGVDDDGGGDSCSKIYGIVLPPYSYIFLSVVMYLAFETGFITLATFLYGRYKTSQTPPPKSDRQLVGLETVKDPESNTDSSKTVGSSKTDLSDNQVYRAFKFYYTSAQVVLSVSTYIYFALSIIGEDLTAWDTYQFLMGRCLNSVIMSAFVGMLNEGAYISTRHKDTEVEYKHEISTNAAIQFYLSAARNYCTFGTKTSDFVAELMSQSQPQEPVIVRTPTTGDSITDNPLHPHVSQPTQQVQQLSYWQKRAIEERKLEESSWLEVVFMVDTMCQWVFSPLFLRRFMVSGILINRQIFFWFPFQTRFILYLTRLIYGGGCYLRKLGIYYHWVFLACLILPPFCTHMFIGMICFALPFFLFGGTLLAAYFLVKEILKTYLSHDSVTYEWIMAAFVKLFWRLLFSAFYQTAFNYAYLLYEGNPFFKIILLDFEMRNENNCFYDKTFDNIEGFVIFFNWL
jgi:hypothetical protein